MEPMLSRPVLASSVAGSDHPIPPGDDDEQKPAIAVRWRSVGGAGLQASGTALIGAGNRLAGDPPVEPAPRPGTSA